MNRVVITGIGWITPMGHSIEETWKRLLAGDSGIARTSLFDAATFPTSISAEQLVALSGDRFEILRELGRGGMATVHLANDRALGRQVAIKVLHPALASALGAERFEQEIRHTARLVHPNSVPLFVDP